MSWFKRFFSRPKPKDHHMSQAITALGQWAMSIDKDIRLETNLAGFGSKNEPVMTITFIHREDKPKGGLAAIAGKWPGDETDEEIEEALNAVRGKTK